MVGLLSGCHRIRGHKFSGPESLDEFPRLKAWFKRIDARPAVQVRVTIPKTMNVSRTVGDPYVAVDYI